MPRINSTLFFRTFLEGNDPRVAQRDTLKERREKSPSCGQSTMGFLVHIPALT